MEYNLKKKPNENSDLQEGIEIVISDKYLGKLKSLFFFSLIS